VILTVSDMSMINKNISFDAFFSAVSDLKQNTTFHPSLTQLEIYHAFN